MDRRALLWSIIYAALLLLCFSKLALVTISLLMIPVVLMFVKLDTGKFVVAYGLTLIAVYAVLALFGAGMLGSIAVIYSLFFLAPSVAMGSLYKKKAPAKTVLTGGTVAFLAQILLFLLLLTLLGVRVTDEMREFVRGSLETTLPAEWRQALPEDLIAQTVEMVVQLLPVYLIGISLYFTVVTHWLSRKLLIRSGEQVPALKPAKDWMLPKSFVWIYLVALVLSFMFTKPDGSLMYMIQLNVLPLVSLAFIVQAVGFCFFAASVKGWSKKTPVIVTIVCVFLMLVIPGAYRLFTLLGLFDVVFPIRNRLKNS